MRSFKTLCALITSLFSVSYSFASTPVVSNGLPADGFAGEQVCFDTVLTNSGTPGFGPYYRVNLDAGLTFVSAQILGISPTVTTVGVYPASPSNTLLDPIIDEEVTGNEGDTLVVFSLPVGSVVTGGPDLISNVCLTIDSDADIGTPLDVSLQPVYEFGDTATGDNGPIEGSTVTQSITPTVIAYAFEQNASESERTPGSGYSITYTHTIDVANTKTVSNIALSEFLSADLQFTSGPTISGGTNCTADVQPSNSSPGGMFDISCDSITGSASDNDVTIEYEAYIPDVLDETMCSVSAVNNSSTLDADFPSGVALPQATGSTSVEAKHVAIQRSISATNIDPETTLTITNAIQVSEFATVNSLSIVDELPDGLAFNSHTSLTENGAVITITPSTSVDGDGVTTVTYDVHGQTGDIAPGTVLSITYTVDVQQTYANGDSLLASDVLATSTQASYSLSSGASGCSDSSSANTSIRAIESSKTIVSPQTEYQPGDVVTFRLNMSIPSGDTSGITFTDFFPLPVFDVTSIDLLFGNDITRSSEDTAGLTPTSITANASTNSILIDWPDIDTPTQAGKVISVDVAATIDDEPFADNLSLTNLFQNTAENSDAEVTTRVENVALVVRAPNLTGELTIDSASTGDAGDTIEFTLALENEGGAPAYDVVVTAPAINGLDSATISDVLIDNSSSSAYSFDSATGVLTLDDPVSASSTVDVEFERVVASSVEPRQEIDVSTSVVWASGVSATKFPAIENTQTFTVDSASVAVSVDSVSPNGSGSTTFVVGDTVTYLAEVTLPEGQVRNLSADIALPPGLSYTSSSVSVNTTGFNGVIDTSPTITTSGVLGTGQTVSISFGDPVNTEIDDDNDTSNNTFSFTLDAVVADDSANDAGMGTQSKEVSADITYTDFSGDAVSATTSSDFIEHQLSVTTSVSPNSGLEAGDSVTVTIEVENTGQAPAYDVEVSSVVNSAILDTTSISEGTTPSGYTFNYASNEVTYALTSGQLDSGSTVTFTYTGEVKTDVQTGTEFDIDATASADSQSGAVTGERSVSETESATASTINPGIDSLTITASSESWTTDTPSTFFAVGEQITYRLVASVPEGITSETGTEALIEFTLPAGMAFIAGSATLQGVFESGLSTANNGALSTTATSFTPVVDGQTVQFDLGDVTNSDSDGNDEQIIAVLTAQVLNTSDVNRNDSKQVLGSINYENHTSTSQSDSDSVTGSIALPNLTITNVASPTTVDGGDTVTYTLEATNETGTAVARGWEWEITQSISTRLENLSLTSVTLSRGAEDITGCGSFSGNDLTIDTSCQSSANAYIGEGESVTVVYTATVDTSVAFEEEITTTAEFTATSLPGTNGTGDVVTGAPDSDTGERTGSNNNNTSGQAVNDVKAMADETITAGAPTLTLQGTSSEANIGTFIDLSVEFGIPTGTTDNFVYTLDLPDNLSYTGAEITITEPVSDFSTSLTPDTEPGAGTDPIVLDFGTISNTSSSAQTLSISVPVQVDNVIANQRGVTLEPEASVNYDGASLPLPSDTLIITVTEPDLNIVQTITSGATGSDAGDTITYQTVISNTDTNATAFNVDWSDVMPAGLLGAPDGTGSGNAFINLSLNNTSGSVVLAGTSTAVSTADFSQGTTTNTGDTLTLASIDIPPSTSITLTYDIVVENSAVAGDTYINDTALTYESLATGTGVRDGSTADSDDDDNTDLNNYNESDSSSITLANAIAIQSALNSVHTSNDFAPGESVTFDIRVDLVEGAIDNVEIVNELPDGVRFESSSVSAGSNITIGGSTSGVVDVSNDVTFDLGTVSNTSDSDTTNDFITISIVATILDVVGNAASTTLTNSVAASGGGASAGPTTLEFDIVEPSLDVTFEANRSSVTLGDSVTYTFSATPEANSSDAYETLLDIEIPEGLTYVLGSFMGDGVLDDTDFTALSVDLGTVAVIDGAKTFTFEAIVDTDVSAGESLQIDVTNGEYTSAAGANADERAYEFSLNESVVSDDSSDIDATQTFTLSNDVNNNGFADPGDTLTITATLTNTGVDADSVIFEHEIPNSTTYVANSAVTSSGTITDSGSISANIGAVTSGQIVTVSFDVTINSGVSNGTTISAQGFVDSEVSLKEPTDADNNDSNGDQANTIRVGEPAVEAPDLYVTQQASLTNDNDADSAISAGDVITLTYVFENSGNTSLSNIDLADAIPDGLTYVNSSAEISGTGNSVTVLGQNLSANIPSLTSGQLVTLTLDLMIDDPLFDSDSDSTSETFLLQGSFFSDTTDSENTDSNGNSNDGNQALEIQAVDGIAGEPNVSSSVRIILVDDVDGDGLVDSGDTVRIETTVANNGAGEATNVFIDHAIPNNTSVVGGTASTSQGSIVTSEPFSVNVGSLLPGETINASIDVIVEIVADNTVITTQSTVSGSNFIDVSSDDNATSDDGSNPTLVTVTSATSPPVDTSLDVLETSNVSTSGANISQAETITLTTNIDLPAGITDGLAISITLPNELSYIDASAALVSIYGTGLSSGQNPGDINASASGNSVFVTLTEVGNVLSLGLGSVINSDNDNDTETYTLSFTLEAPGFVPAQLSETVTVSSEVTYLDSLSQVQSLGVDDLLITLINRLPETQPDTFNLVEDDPSTVFDVLINDSDEDTGQSLSIISVGSAASGASIALSSDNLSIVYTPPLNFDGVDTFTYTVSDGAGGIVTETVTVNFTPQEDDPIASDDIAEVNEDESIDIDVLSNDEEPDGDPLTVDSVVASVGTVSVATNGTLNFTPPANFNGNVILTYTISDDNGNSDIATVTVTVIPVNDAPIAVDDTTTMLEDSTLTFNVLSNDSDPDGDALSLESVSTGNGQVSIGAGGSILFNPTENFFGSVDIDYIISDGNGGSATAILTVNIENVNDAPVVPIPDVNTIEGEPVTFDLLTDASDADGDELFIGNVSALNGTVVVNSDGTITFTPNDDFSGIASVTVCVEDGNGGETCVVVNIDVISNNTAPIVFDVEQELDQNTSITLDLTGQDAEGDALSYSFVAAPDGSITGNLPIITYTPPTDFSGNIVFTYQANDGELDSNVGTVTLSVIADESNTAPIVFDVQLAIEEDQSVSLNLTGEDPEGDELTYSFVTNADGTMTGELPFVTYTPPENYNGEIVFSYQANDGELDSNIGIVTITVLGVNDAPLAIDDIIQTLDFDPVSVSVLDNDSDPDGDALRVIGASVPIGNLSFNDTEVIYTPIDGFIGNVVIDYTIEDEEGLQASARILISIDPEGRELLPVINVPDDILIDATALFTKVDLGVATAVDRFGNPLPVSVVDGVTFYEPGNNTAFWLAEDAEGRRSIASQAVRVRPLVSTDKDQNVLEGRSVVVGVNLNGTSPIYPLEIPYTISGTADEEDHNLTDGVLVFESGSRAEIRFDTFVDDDTEEGETIVLTLSDSINRGNKFEHVITLREDNVNPDAELFAEQSGETRVTVTQNGGIVNIISEIDHPDVTNVYFYDWESRSGVLDNLSTDETGFTFDPAINPLGIYEVILTVTDADAPDFGDRTSIFIEVVDVLATLGDEDTDGDGIPDSEEGYRDSDRDGIPDYLDPIPECNVLPEEGAFVNGYLVEGDPGVCLRIGNFAIGGDSAGAEILDNDYERSDVLVIDDEATNIGGIFDFIAYGLPVEGQSYKIVIPQRRPVPVEAVYRKFTEEDGWQTFVEQGSNRLWSTPGEPGFCPPPGGNIWEPGLQEGYWCVQVEIVDGGPYDADGIANGTVVDPGGVGVIGVGLNGLPNAEDDVAELLPEQTVEIDVLANDTDPDGDLLFITSANAVFGEATHNDFIVFYTPRDGFVGEDQIIYGISDGNGGTDLAVVRLLVIANNPPVAVNDTVTMNVGATVIIDVLANDSDANGDRLSITNAQTSSGKVIINSDDTLSFTPLGGFSGQQIIDYEISDNNGGVAAAQVVVTVNPVTVRIKNEGGGALQLIWIWLLLCVVIAKRLKRGTRMKMRRKQMTKLNMFLLFIGLSVNTVFARDHNDSHYCVQSEQGSCLLVNWFLHGSVGFASGDYSENDVTAAAFDVGFDVFDVTIDDSRTAFKIMLGTSLDDHWQAEIGYVDLGDVQAAFSTTTTNPEAFFALTQNIRPTSIDGVTLSFSYSWFYDEDWLLKARIGGLFWEGNYDSFDVTSDSTPIGVSHSDGTDLILGLGIHYNVTDDIYALLEYDFYTIDSDNVGVIGAGLVVLF